MEGTRNRLTTAICTALSVGALASAGAIAHEVDNAQASATSSPSTDTSSTSTTSSSSTETTDTGRTADADQSNTSASQPNTSGYGAGTGTSASASTDGATPSSQASGTTSNASSDYDQSRTGATRSGSGSPGMQGVDEVVWFVVPVALASQGDQMSNGCWVKLYSGDDFEGRSVSIVGPTGIRELRSPYGTGLNNWESAVVGPNATVTTYDDEDFRARNATLRAGQRYPDLDDSKLGLFDDIESIKVACSNASGSGSGSGTR